MPSWDILNDAMALDGWKGDEGRWSSRKGLDKYLYAVYHDLVRLGVISMNQVYSSLCS